MVIKSQSLNESKYKKSCGMLVINYPWRIHLSECGGRVATINAWATIKNTHETKIHVHDKKKKKSATLIEPQNHLYVVCVISLNLIQKT
jgi:hypothetical protein